jgi:hypothetical protein
MAAVGYSDSWDEFFLISIQRKGGSVIDMAGIVDDITTFNIGDKDIDVIPLSNGGRVVKKMPMTMGELTLKCYPVSGDLSGSNPGFIQYFNPQSTDDTTQPISVSNTNDRDKFQIVILRSSSLPSAPSSAVSATTTDQSGERYTIKNAYLVSYKIMHEDKQESVEVTFKWAPFDKSGTSNMTYDSTDGSSILTAVTTYS